jgi:phage gp29-like protein
MAVQDLPYLVDPNGKPISSRPLNKAALTQEVAGPVLMGVRSIMTGHPSQGLTPQRLGAILREAENGDAIAYLELAEQMEEGDLHYRSVLGTRKFAVTQLKITVEPASDSADDQANADLISDWLKRDELQMELFDIQDAVGKGFSLTEIIWETSAKEWMPKSLTLRDPRWFIMDRINGVDPLLRDVAGFLPLDPYKFIYHRSRSKSGLPIRGGLARPVAWAWMFKNYSLKDWVAFAEVFGMPLRLGKYEVGETEENINRLASAVANMGSDAAAVIAKSMDIEFVDSGKGSGAAPGELYKSLCDFLDQQTSKGVLGQTATTDAINGGHAVGKTHNEVRGDLKRADAIQLQATLNRDLVKGIVFLNRGEPASGVYPRIIIEEEDDPLEVGAMATAATQLVPLGLRIKKSEVLQRLGFTEAGPEDEVLEVAKPPAAPESGGPGKPGDPADPEADDKPPPGAPTISEEAQGADADDAASVLISALQGGWRPRAAPSLSRRAARGFLRLLWPLTGRSGAVATAAGAGSGQADAIDHALDDALSDWRPLIEPVVSPVERLVASASSLEDLRDKLAGAVEAMSVDDLAQLLAEASFTSRIAGVAGHPLSPKSEP